MAKNRPVKISRALRQIYDRAVAALPSDDFRSRSLCAHMNRLVSGLEALESMAETRDPTRTDDHHVKKVADGARAYMKKCEEIAEILNDLNREHSTALDRAIIEKASLLPGQYAEETRRALRELPAEGRNTALLNALDSNNAAVIAAVTDPDIPSFVSGVDPQFAGRIREQYMQRAAPAEYEQQSRLYDTLSSGLAAVSAGKKQAETLTDPRRVAEIVKAAEKAEAAEKGFSEAMGG